jgi:hypothetical protein
MLKGDVGSVRRIGGLVAAVCMLLVVPVAGNAARPAGSSAPLLALTWNAPTPVDGASFSLEPGSTLTLPVAVASPSGGPARIEARGLPAGANLSVTSGNPASAIVTWKVPMEISDYVVVFVARGTRTPRLAAPPRTFFLRVRPALPPGSAVLSNAGGLSRWAPIVRPVAARAAPGAVGGVVARLGRVTSEGSQNIALLLDAQRDGQGRVWIRIRLSVLPNNSTGWVPRAALGAFRTVGTHLVVSRELYTATLYRSGKAIFTTRVGIGQRQWPTPRGHFYIREKITGFTDPMYGPVAFGTSARSAVLTDWPGGGVVGIHGTNRPGILPGAVSHGCIRMRNQAILRLARLLPIGTPLTIH